MISELSVEAYARRQLDRLGKSAKQLRRGDPMAIHDARVASRRLDAALDVLLARGPREPRGKESRALQRLRRRLGPLREREGITQALRERIKQGDPETRLVGEWLIDRLEKRVTRGRRRAVRRIERRHRQVRALRKAKPRSVSSAEALVWDALRWMETRRADAIGTIAVARRTRKPEDLHEARKAVKQWRYALEVLDQATGQPNQEQVQRVIELQRCLGAIHDDDVLREFLRRSSRRWRREHHEERAAVLSRLLRRLGASRRRELLRLDDAWETASPLAVS